MAYKFNPLAKLGFVQKPKTEISANPSDSEYISEKATAEAVANARSVVEISFWTSVYPGGGYENAVLYWYNPIDNALQKWDYENDTWHNIDFEEKKIYICTDQSSFNYLFEYYYDAQSTELSEINLRLFATDATVIAGTNETAPVNSKGILAAFVDWISTKTFAGLNTTNKTVKGAINELQESKANRSLSFCTNIPATMSTPPLFTAGVLGDSSKIAGSVLVESYRNGAFYVNGGSATRGIYYPDYIGLKLGTYPQITSSSPTSVDFILDTSEPLGKFEIVSKGTSGGFRLLIKNKSTGKFEYATSGYSITPHPSDGGQYIDLVQLGSAGVYEIKFQFTPGTVFFGLRTLATDTVTANYIKNKRYIIVGDSFTEPTFSESGSRMPHDGYGALLNVMTDIDIWCAGSGGTGYLATNGARPKLRDRLQNDILSFNPDGIIWACGINDTLHTGSEVRDEALLCYNMVKNYNPKIDNIVLSPFWPKGIDVGANTNLLEIRDGIKYAASSCGFKFIDLLSISSIDETWSSNLVLSYVANSNNIKINSVPSSVLAKIANGGTDGWFIQIGEGATAEIRRVTNVILNGDNTYTISLASNITNSHSLGEVVKCNGASYVTGNGKQGSTNNSGNADRFTGADSTHPTKAGHEYIARIILNLIRRNNAL